jgi:MYXO-CTERM domain-containing protein
VPTTRKPEVIVREIEQTRAELADAIDAITGRINPRRAATRSAQVVREQVASDVSSIAEGKPRPAVIIGAAAVGLLGLVLIRRRH